MPFKSNLRHYNLEWAVQVRPGNIRAAVDLGMTLLAAGRFKESVDSLKRVAGAAKPTRWGCTS